MRDGLANHGKRLGAILGRTHRLINVGGSPSVFVSQRVGELEASKGLRYEWCAEHFERPSRDLTENQSHSDGCYQQFHEPSEGIRRSNSGGQLDEQRIRDE